MPAAAIRQSISDLVTKQEIAFKQYFSDAGLSFDAEEFRAQHVRWMEFLAEQAHCCSGDVLEKAGCSHQGATGRAFDTPSSI